MLHGIPLLKVSVRERSATNEFVKALLDVILPPRCHLCRSFIQGEEDIHICTMCRETITLINAPICEMCGVPFQTEGGCNHVCGACLSSPPPYTAARAALLFEGKTKELIHRFKYGNKSQCSRPLGLLTIQHLAQFVTAISPDVLLPVPLHPKRLRHRSFNQALLLSEILGKAWHLPISRSNLQRIRWTEPQINLSAEERVRNVRGAFAVTDPQALSGKRVVLVDDVYTTGSTVAECARVLKGAGTEAVYVATVARAPL